MNQYSDPTDQFDYNDQVKSKLLNDITKYKKILTEIEEVNKDFYTLRTKIVPNENIMHFIMYPADGAICDKPLFGRIFIPLEYPAKPPVVHMLTKTGRYNVDIFNNSTKTLINLASSMCFDILQSTWKPDYTITTIIASLLQSIVSIDIPQMYGPPVKEIISMEKLKEINNNVNDAYKKYSIHMPPVEPIKPIEGEFIGTEMFGFKKYSHSSFVHNQDSILVSEPFNLFNGKSYSVGIDLKELKNNINTVFSVILTSDSNDLVGRKADTVLFRNGVTATAATKRKGANSAN